MAQTTETPIMRQYDEMKKKHPDAVVLFRIGDFYETISDDAKTVSEICGVTLTTRNDGDSGKTYLAGFPHQSLDRYLPLMVRAGKRVAICEQLENPATGKVEDGTFRSVETVTPGVPEEPKQEEPKQKPKERMAFINCTVDTRDKGEPEAWFTIDMPRIARVLGGLTDNSGHFPVLSKIMIEPGSGKLVASDSIILYTVDIECDGIWPEEAPDGRPYRCYIDPKAIGRLAGKKVDVAAWNENGTIITGCEATGIVSQTSVKARFPDWTRFLHHDGQAVMNIRPDELKPLRDFMKANMGKTKQERSSRTVSITADRSSDILTLEITENRGIPGEAVQVAAFNVCLSEKPDWYIRQIYRADLFYYSVQEDFSGEIRIRADHTPALFTGEMRQSVLQPVPTPADDKTYCTQSWSSIK